MSNTNFYHDCLSEELQQQVSAQLKLLLPEQLSLNEEVAIHKAKCKDSVAAWNQARQALKAVEARLQKDPNSVELIQLLRSTRAHLDSAGEKMAENLKLQKDMVMSAVVSDAKTREVLTQNTLMLLLNAVLDLVHNYFNEGTEESIAILNRFEDELRTRVVFQEADDLSIGIEEEFVAMMGTVAGPDTQETTVQGHLE